MEDYARRYADELHKVFEYEGEREERQRRDISRLFWAIIRIVLSVNFSILGLIRIDFLPGFLGYAAIWETMQMWQEEKPTPHYVGRLCWLCGAWDLLSWFPWLYDRIPSQIVTAVSAVVVVCNAIIFWYMLQLVRQLAQNRNRDDLASSGDRYSKIFVVGYPLLCALHSMLGMWQAPFFAILLIFELMLAAYVANCNHILFPESEEKKEAPQV